MKMTKIIRGGMTAALALTATAGMADTQHRIDIIRPDAPALANYGQYPVGVITHEFTDTGRADVLGSLDRDDVPQYDRKITTEIWYPAQDAGEELGAYTTFLRDGETKVEIYGRAMRDAQAAEGSFPLVLISHGYPGNRFLMSHLGENLASKGYVVVSADHPESIYSDQQAFISTLVNRPLDQAFLIDAMAGDANPLADMTDVENAAVIGYSMGGYGALMYGGAGLSETAVTRNEPDAFTHPHGLLDQLAAGSEAHESLVDDRIKAIIAIGPWGRNRDFWDADGVSGIEKPLLIIAGGEDDISEYDAIREIFQEARGTNRYLLTFDGANHNAAAPYPAHPASYAVSEKLGWAPFGHYADAVWDTTRMNNILQHFSTGFLDIHLKGETEKQVYFDLVEYAEEGVWAMDEGQPTEDHSYWEGFPERSAKGLRFEVKSAGE